MRITRRMSGVFCLVVLVAMLIGACATKSVDKGMVPKWFLNPPESKDKIYGTGASEVTQSVSIAKNVSDAAAIDEVARTIQVSVQNMTRTFLQQSGTLDAARALQFSETISKQVVDVSLTGVKVTQRDYKEGRGYALAEISMDSVKNSLLNAVRDAAAQLAEQKAKDAFKDLENEVNKGNIPVVKQ